MAAKQAQTPPLPRSNDKATISAYSVTLRATNKQKAVPVELTKGSKNGIRQQKWKPQCSLMCTAASMVVSETHPCGTRQLGNRAFDSDCKSLSASTFCFAISAILSLQIAPEKKRAPRHGACPIGPAAFLFCSLPVAANTIVSLATFSGRCKPQPQLKICPCRSISPER